MAELFFCARPEPCLHAQAPVRTSSAANLRTAVKGASSGTLKTRKGSLGSEVSTTLKVTLLMAAVARVAGAARQAIHERDVWSSNPAAGAGFECSALG